MSRPSLTPTQDRIFRFIQSYVATNGFAPSVKDIARGVDLYAKSAVSYQLGQLQRKGYITRAPRVARGLTVVGEA